MAFRIEFNQFNITRARMLDSIYHMAIKLLKIACFGMVTQNLLSFTQR